MNNKNYLMLDNKTGEEFIVEAIDEANACHVARQYFEDFTSQGEIDAFWAEMLGVDTY